MSFIIGPSMPFTIVMQHICPSFSQPQKTPLNSLKQWRFTIDTTVLRLCDNGCGVFRDTSTDKHEWLLLIHQISPQTKLFQGQDLAQATADRCGRRQAIRLRNAQAGQECSMTCSSISNAK
jgi:hypothetical protein